MNDDYVSAADRIANRGYWLTAMKLPEAIRRRVIDRDWPALDREVAGLVRPGGLIFEELRRLARFESIEFIISIRSSREFPDEDGIWHDDGSRVLAFSLSLTLDPESIEGGRLEIRRRGQADAPSESIAPPPFGAMIVFATGHQGFEHKINRVARGERVIIAGWCT